MLNTIKIWFVRIAILLNKVDFPIPIVITLLGILLIVYTWTFGGTISFPSIQGHHYFLTIIDDHSRHTWIFLVKNKGETQNCIMNFLTFIRNQFCVKVKAIRSDNGIEFNMPSYILCIFRDSLSKIMCGNPTTKFSG